MTSPNSIQHNIDLIQHWSTVWQMKISYTKCNILSLGPLRNFKNKIFLDKHHIKQVNAVKDLGVTVDTNLKFRKHINDIVLRANQRSALISRCFLSRNPQNLTRAYKIYVRPLVEYSSSVWSPTYFTQINQIESVQRRLTKRIPGCGHLSYADRLKHLQLQSLEHRRLIADLIICYNIVYGHSCLQFGDFFKFSNNRSTRGHPKKLLIPLIKSNIRRHFFVSRIIPVWNDLSPNAVLAPNIKSFKNIISKTDLTKFLIFPSVFITA